MTDILSDFARQFPWYLCRWELSTFILAPVIWYGTRRRWNSWACAALANAIGAGIFYWVDKYLIFG
ncbi:MAG: hypothetical protein WC749_02540 [Dehalococcoidia bacterium]